MNGVESSHQNLKINLLDVCAKLVLVVHSDFYKSFTSSYSSMSSVLSGILVGGLRNIFFYYLDIVSIANAMFLVKVLRLVPAWEEYVVVVCVVCFDFLCNRNFSFVFSV